MIRYFWQNRVQARSKREALERLAAKAETRGYRVLLAKCHEVPWLAGWWDGIVEIDYPG